MPLPVNLPIFDSLTTQLGTILDQLALVANQHTSTPISPVLALHPPGQRTTHAAFLQKRQDDTNVMLAALLSVEKKVTAIRAGIYRHQQACCFAQAPMSALPDEILCRIFSFPVKDGKSAY